MEQQDNKEIQEEETEKETDVQKSLKAYKKALREASLMEVAIEATKNTLPFRKDKFIANSAAAAGVGLWAYLSDPVEATLTLVGGITAGACAIYNNIKSDGGLAATELLVRRPLRTVTSLASPTEDGTKDKSKRKVR